MEQTVKIMITKIIRSDPVDEAVSLLKKGEVVAVPTETVYGLAADAKNDLAVKKIFNVKNRPSDHPLIVHIEKADSAVEWADSIPAAFYKLAANFWPGPLTVILPKRNSVSDIITGGLDTVALRVPNHPTTLKIIEKIGNGIVAPSANAHKKTSPTKPEHVLRSLEGKICAVIDGGMCAIGLESTIIDLTQKTPRILRFGAITADMIEKVLGTNVESPASHKDRVSGNMKIHYQPNKPLFLVSISELEEVLQKNSKVAVIHYSDVSKVNYTYYYKMSENKDEYARDLYNALHLVDGYDIAEIFVEKPPLLPEWSDVNDRLIKASFKE